MEVICPHCGGSVPVEGLGRKKLSLSVNNVYEALRSYNDSSNCMTRAARDLGCSRGYIYKVLKDAGMRWDPDLKRVTKLS